MAFNFVSAREVLPGTARAASSTRSPIRCFRAFATVADVFSDSRWCVSLCRTSLITSRMVMRLRAAFFDLGG